jgi:hypothetical protein
MPNEDIKIAIIEQRLVDFIAVVDKLERAINKINDVNLNILNMLAVHNEKIDQFYKHHDAINKTVNDMSERNDESINYCLEKIDHLESTIDQLPDLNDMSKKLEDLMRIKWIIVGTGGLVAAFVTILASIQQLWPNYTNPKPTNTPPPIEKVVPIVPKVDKNEVEELKNPEVMAKGEQSINIPRIGIMPT